VASQIGGDEIAGDAPALGGAAALGGEDVPDSAACRRIEPMAVTSLLAKLGTSDPIEPRLSLDDLVAEFDFAKFSRTIPRFDPAELQRLEDTAGWWQVVTGPVTPVVADAALLSAAAGLLPPEPWTDATWGEWTAAVRDRTGIKGKPLFLTLRLALTGLDHGPELRGLLPLIGRDRALGRLSGHAA